MFTQVCPKTSDSFARGTFQIFNVTMRVLKFWCSNFFDVFLHRNMKNQTSKHLLLHAESQNLAAPEQNCVEVDLLKVCAERVTRTDNI